MCACVCVCASVCVCLNISSLLLEVLHQICHVVQLSSQTTLLVTQCVKVAAQVSDVGLKHGIDAGAGGGLVLQETPLGLQHLVLLLQVTHLCAEMGRATWLHGVISVFQF